MITNAREVEPVAGGLLTYADTGEVVGYLFTHRGDDNPTPPGAHTLAHTLTGVWAPSGYLGDLPQEVVSRHNLALEALEVKRIIEGLPDRLSAYWVDGTPNYWHGGGCVCQNCTALGWHPASPDITLWTGKVIGRVIWRGQKSRTLGGARKQWLRVAIGSAVYGGYATSTRDIVHLKRLKGVV